MHNFEGCESTCQAGSNNNKKKCSISIVLILHCALSISNSQRQVYRAQKLEVLHNSKIVGDESKGQSVA